MPIQFLKAVLPDPKSLGANYHGQTSIGCRIRGVKDGKEHTYYIYNNCDHEQAYKETGTQAVSFTTGVPAALGASMWAKGSGAAPVSSMSRSSTPIPSWPSWASRDCLARAVRRRYRSLMLRGQRDRRTSLPFRICFRAYGLSDHAPVFCIKDTFLSLFCIIYDTFYYLCDRIRN